MTLPLSVSHQLSSARLAVASFFQSILCQSIFARIDPQHAQPYQGETLLLVQAAHADFISVLSHIESLTFAARAERIALPLLPHSSKTRARLSPPLESSAPLAAPPLDDAFQSTHLDSLLARFAYSRDVILSIEHHTQTLAKFTSALDGPALATFNAAAQRYPSMDLDPLSIPSVIALISKTLLSPSFIIAPIHTLAPTLSALAQANENAFSDARTALLALRSLRTRRLRATEQCRTSIDPLDAPLPYQDTPQSIELFERWSDKLHQVSLAGQHAPVAIGLTKLLLAMHELSSTESQALALARAPMDELADLRGRFSAFKAKARALSSSVHPLLPRAQLLQDACRRALETPLVPLGTLRKAQRAFESCLSDIGV